MTAPPSAAMYADPRLSASTPRWPQGTLWPNGRGLAVWIVINVECWPVDYLGPGAMPWPQQPPDVPNATYREYGNQVGVWRLMAMLDALGVPASVALNSAMCVHRPDIVRACADRGWDVMGHGVDQSRAMNRIPPEVEEEEIEQVLATIGACTGARPEGWLGPGLAETARTADLLAARGVRYVADRLDDHLPYLLNTNTGQLVAVPYSLDLNDYTAFATLALTGGQYADMLVDQFDVLVEEAASEARVMCVPLHTYLSGVPHRCKHLAKALAHLCRHERTWCATGAQIARTFREHCLK